MSAYLRHRNVGRIVRFSFSVVMFAAVSGGRAAVYCVTTGDVVGLQAAMSDASINGGSDEIRLQGGFYSIPANFLDRKSVV